MHRRLALDVRCLTVCATSDKPKSAQLGMQEQYDAPRALGAAPLGLADKQSTNHWRPAISRSRIRNYGADITPFLRKPRHRGVMLISPSALRETQNRQCDVDRISLGSKLQRISIRTTAYPPFSSPTLNHANLTWQAILAIQLPASHSRKRKFPNCIPKLSLTGRRSRNLRHRSHVRRNIRHQARAFARRFP